MQGGVDPVTHEVVVQLRDNGINFWRNTAGQLFQPFARLPGDDFSGYGVGLSIVRRAIERQGGWVWEESKSGSGASFFFSRPGDTHQRPHETCGTSLNADGNALSFAPPQAHLAPLSDRKHGYSR